ncbi:hypothetical protein [Bacillus mobilis]|uniref:hypothetical protein n=1 Tax=Bacillus mobilis TaxID=2026190 RepID=UPI002E236548|nr:hypothetical protein [Bacillus mobilis]MED0930875.1 hypothetical protein [Bacillus mobilis]MED0953526.1 hypothetical protein [Bacillus mobilis]
MKRTTEFALALLGSILGVAFMFSLLINSASFKDYVNGLKRIDKLSTGEVTEVLKAWGVDRENIA